MNIVILTGELSEYAETSETKDGQTMVDGCIIKKLPAKDGGEIEKKFFFRAVGKIADIFLDNYEPHDLVLIRGRLLSGGDERGNYFTRIQIKDIEKICGVKNDNG